MHVHQWHPCICRMGQTGVVGLEAKAKVWLRVQEAEAGNLCREETVWQVLWEAAQVTHATVPPDVCTRFERVQKLSRCCACQHQGLEFLHSHGIIVMDVKPDNLFRNRGGTFQIGDFGLAITSSQDEVGSRDTAGPH